jgi:hypothetical protein
LSAGAEDVRRDLAGGQDIDEAVRWPVSQITDDVAAARTLVTAYGAATGLAELESFAALITLPGRRSRAYTRWFGSPRDLTDSDGLPAFEYSQRPATEGRGFKSRPLLRKETPW